MVFIEVEIGEHYHYSGFYAILNPIKNHKNRSAVFAKQQTRAMNEWGAGLYFSDKSIFIAPRLCSYDISLQPMFLLGKDLFVW